MSWWQNDIEKKDTYDLIDEGKYVSYLSDCSLDETKDYPRLTLKWKISDGKFKNRLMFQNFNIKADMSEKQIQFITWQLGTLGIWSALKEALDEWAMARMALTELGKLLNKIHVEMNVKHREYEGKTFLNLTITGDAWESDPLIEAAKANQETSEELPF